MLHPSKYISTQKLYVLPCTLYIKPLLRILCYNFDIVMGGREEREWKIFGGRDDHELKFKSYGILILNRPITISPEKMIKLWNEACWRITIDGGTDRWFEFVNQHSLPLSLPNYVTGDFDSIKPKTLEFCQNQDEITVKNTPDQDFTDFDKALDCFVAISEHSGRLDQIFSNINTLARVQLDGFILSQSAITWLLHPGYHRIHIPDYLRSQKVYCGVLPFSEAKVTSKGLKWNLNSNTIKFGGLLSSSNTYDGSPVVEIDTDANIIWTMGCEKY
ncbi:thiamin pyrophosphokinase 1 isoform X2 [Halyomorpha halys]|uniref:thiamin pyrophosphokinase 1 isoform X2 n=1 Tax=Halyomorpha halys TaxID=286706 RepID=UPI0006D51844|nr:thiamin pyrophosphokinase 1-like isoform X2 [Halyomorpha halys]